MSRYAQYWNISRSDLSKIGATCRIQLHSSLLSKTSKFQNFSKLQNFSKPKFFKTSKIFKTSKEKNSSFTWFIYLFQVLLERSLNFLQFRIADDTFDDGYAFISSRETMMYYVTKRSFSLFCRFWKLGHSIQVHPEM